MRMANPGVACLMLLLAPDAATAAPLIEGIDHIPVVVADLEKAETDYRVLGFAIKPGRFHADGIRNVHVKFADHTEIELITAPATTDALTREYRNKITRSEGPVYFGLYTREPSALAGRLRALGTRPEIDGDLIGFGEGSPLHPLFFGSRQASPTDKPEYFAHENGAVRVAGLWISGGTLERALLAKLGVRLRDARLCGPLGSRGQVAAFPDGGLTFVGGGAAATVVGAKVEIRDHAGLTSLLRSRTIAAQTFTCDRNDIWVSPASAHGVWLQFSPAR